MYTMPAPLLAIRAMATGTQLEYSTPATVHGSATQTEWQTSSQCSAPVAAHSGIR
jgi:hypothetical protein